MENCNVGDCVKKCKCKCIDCYKSLHGDNHKQPVVEKCDHIQCKNPFDGHCFWATYSKLFKAFLYPEDVYKEKSPTVPICVNNPSYLKVLITDYEEMVKKGLNMEAYYLKDGEECLINELQIAAAKKEGAKEALEGLLGELPKKSDWNGGSAYGGFESCLTKVKNLIQQKIQVNG